MLVYMYIWCYKLFVVVNWVPSSNPKEPYISYLDRGLERWIVGMMVWRIVPIGLYILIFSHQLVEVFGCIWRCVVVGVCHCWRWCVTGSGLWAFKRPCRAEFFFFSLSIIPPSSFPLLVLLPPPCAFCFHIRMYSTKLLLQHHACLFPTLMIKDSLKP